MGSAVPHKKLRDIHRYAEINPLKNLVFAKVRARLDKQKPIQFLAATGLVSLIEKHGLHPVSKIFPSSEWAWLKKKFLESTTEAELPRLSSMLKKSIEDWLENRIRFPRPRSEDEQ